MSIDIKKLNEAAKNFHAEYEKSVSQVYYENQQLREENEKYRKDNDRMYRNNIELQAQYKKELDRVSDVCKTLNSQLNDKHSYSCQLFEENEKLKAENSKLGDAYNELSTQNMVFAPHNYDSNCDCDKCAIKNLKAENETLSKNIKSVDLNKIHDVYQKAIEHEVKYQESRYCRLLNENQQLKAENEELSKQKVMLRNDDLRKQIKNLKQELDTQVKCNKLLVEQLKAQLQQPTQVSAKQCSQCKSSHVEIGNLCEECRINEAYKPISEIHTERKPLKTEAEHIIKFRLGDRVAVYREGRDTFRGTIFNMYHNKIYVIEDGFYSAHDDSPFLPSQCRKLKKVKRKPQKSPDTATCKTIIYPWGCIKITTHSNGSGQIS